MLSCILDLEPTISKPEAGSVRKLTNKAINKHGIFVVHIKSNVRCLSFGYDNGVI